jgi:asparagine synthase (glutamine-hydrolysing)
LKRGRRYLLAYAGVMGIQDGVEYALRALAVLVHQRGRRDVSLALLGDGDQRLPVMDLCRSLTLDEYVHFTGWVTTADVLRYLTVADVCLSPDPSNEVNDRSTMIKTMEYMALGKPVVAFDMPETRFSAGEAALYATPNAVEDYAEKIARLLDDEPLRLSMGAAGRRRIEQELCWDHARDGLRRAYERLFPA